MNTDKHDENIIAAYAAIPHDHGRRAKIATFDLVTAIMHCRAPSLALAQYARDETEHLVHERDALRAANKELVATLRDLTAACTSGLSPDMGARLPEADKVQRARALLAKLGEGA